MRSSRGCKPTVCFSTTPSNTLVRAGPLSSPSYTLLTTLSPLATPTDYLSAKGVFDIAPTKLKSIAMWSARFWAAYVALYVSLFSPHCEILTERVFLPVNSLSSTENMPCSLRHARLSL